MLVYPIERDDITNVCVNLVHLGCLKQNALCQFSRTKRCFSRSALTLLIRINVARTPQQSLRAVYMCVRHAQAMFCHISLLFRSRTAVPSGTLHDKHVALCRKAINLYSAVARYAYVRTRVSVERRHMCCCACLSC